MSTWPRHRGPILVPLAAVTGTVLVLALLINGAHARTQEARKRLNTAANQPTRSSEFELGPSASRTSATPTPSPTGAPLPGKPKATATANNPPGKPKATAAPDLPIITAALAGVRAWQQPRVAIRQASLKAISTPEYLALMAQVDPRQIPQSPPKTTEVINDSDGFARVSVTLVDGTALLVDLKLVKKLWLTADIAPGG